MTAGYELTQDQRYLDAARRGADFLLDRFRDPVHGGFFHVVAADGRVVSDIKRSYGHAFALHALAHLYRVSKDPRYREAALRTWQEVNTGLRDPKGGLFIDASRSFVPSRGGRTQNPVMHMFEALLVLSDATEDPAARAGAKSIGDFVVYQLLQGLPDGGARIAEWYDDSWTPLPSKDKGGYYDLGHQFEWTHLLLSGARQGLSPIYASVAERVLDYALKVGYDEQEGGAYSRAYPDGSLNRDKGWWQQSECLHALLAAAAATGRNDLWRRYEQTLSLIQNELIDAKQGGWHGGALSLCRAGRCPDEQPDPYHMTAMHMAAIATAGKP